MYNETLLLLFAHEVKDAFSRLGGYLGLLKHQMISESENEFFIQSLEEEFTENRAYINDLLVWSKEKRSAKPTAATETSLAETILGIIKTQEIKKMAEYKCIEFVHKIPDMVLKTDKTLYTIVLKNILKNALKFSDPNENIFLRVFLKYNKVVTCVTDRGIGISGGQKIDIERLSKMDARLHNAGSGMALSLCREILKKEGGELWGVNNPEGGASFSFTLPFS